MKRQLTAGDLHRGNGVPLHQQNVPGPQVVVSDQQHVVLYRGRYQIDHIRAVEPHIAPLIGLCAHLQLKNGRGGGVGGNITVGIDERHQCFCVCQTVLHQLLIVSGVIHAVVQRQAGDDRQELFDQIVV